MRLRSRMNFLPLLSLMAVSLVSCASGPQRATSSAESAAAEPATARPIAGDRVAIFDFEVKGGGPAYESLRGDIPESLAEAFIKGGLVVPVERRELEQAIDEQELALSGLVDEATAARVGRLAGARFALLGSASIIADQIRLACRLIDIETAEILYASSVHGDTEGIYDLLEELAGEVEDGFAR